MESSLGKCCIRLVERLLATVVLSKVLAIDKLLDVVPFATGSSLVP